MIFKKNYLDRQGEREHLFKNSFIVSEKFCLIFTHA